jgi:Ni/Co efflux regulator RcnB
MELLYLDSHARGRERRGVDLATPDLRTWSRGTRSPKRKRHPAGVKNSYRRRRLAVRPPMENTGSPLADSECYDNFLRGT